MKILSVAVFCLIAIGPAQAEKANKAGDAEIEKKLEQIVALRARVFEEQRLLAAEGRRRSADVSGAEIALCRAHIALARERDQPALVIQQLKRAEALFRHKLESAKLEVEMGQADTRVVAEAEIKVLQIQIDLKRAIRRSEESAGG